MVAVLAHMYLFRLEFASLPSAAAYPVRLPAPVCVSAGAYTRGNCCIDRGADNAGPRGRRAGAAAERGGCVGVRAGHDGGGRLRGCVNLARTAAASAGAVIHQVLPHRPGGLSVAYLGNMWVLSTINSWYGGYLHTMSSQKPLSLTPRQVSTQLDAKSGPTLLWLSGRPAWQAGMHINETVAGCQELKVWYCCLKALVWVSV